MAQGLVFDFSWQLIPPADSTYINSAISATAVEEFYQFAETIARRTADEEEVLWMVKREFSAARGVPRVKSSSMYFAPLDAKAEMKDTANNAPLFIATFYKVCSLVEEQYGKNCTPDVQTLNRLLEKHNIGYIIDPPNLILREQVDVVPVHPTNLLEQANQRLRDAADKSEELLREHNFDLAVSHIWWLLESIATAFDGLEFNGQKIKGKYFNEITKSIQQVAPGTTFAAVVRWMQAAQSLLSDPEVGGVRHGTQLHLEGLQPHEAVLFVNLTRSYISYLLAEYEHLSKPA